MIKKKITNDLKALGVQNGGNLLVHASLKSLGEIPEGASAAIQGILDAIGAEGTLLMPALSYESVDETHPLFDLINTPSCIGWLPEYFRTLDGVVRTIHPTHSLSCLGKNKYLFTKSHHKDHTPCGANSPFSLLPKYHGQILMIGCGLKPNTSMHAIEEKMNVPYLFKDKVKYKIITPDNINQEPPRKNRDIKEMSVKRHNFHGYYNQRYDRLEALLSTKAMKRGKVLQADCYLIDAAMMWETAISAIKKDPFYFVEPI